MIDSLLDTVIHGDNLEVMRGMPDSCVDTVITDPPAGIGFMGKSWDKDKGGRDQWIAWLAEIMAECLRVTKPGGVLLCWSIPRTSHWTGMAIEDGGWRIVDKIAHLFGSGFPKSLDISKAIDKHGGHAVGWFGKWLRSWREDNNVPQKEIAALFPSKTGGKTGCVANWELGYNMPTCEQFNTICKHFDLPFESIAEAEREIVGEKGSGLSGGSGNTVGRFTDSRNANGMVDITAPATALAKLWDGWGTALKPSREDWFVAYKPLDGTYAQNAEKWGVAGLWIDGGRIDIDFECGGRESAKNTVQKTSGIGFNGNIKDSQETPLYNSKGRFPSNTILFCTCEGPHEPDCPVRMLDEQSGELHGAGFSKQAGGHKRKENKSCFDNSKGGIGQWDFGGARHGDSGGASRFFYTAKASRAERNAGCEGMEARLSKTMGERSPDTTGSSHNTTGQISVLRQNHHPTVKSLALMEYLCNLTKTPTGGIVLDPFAGSGTTGCAAFRVGRPFILIEKEIDSVEIARARIQHEKDLMGLFE